jgi:hypothetical protein
MFNKDSLLLVPTCSEYNKDVDDTFDLFILFRYYLKKKNKIRNIQNRYLT